MFDELRHFLAVVEVGTLTAAGRKVGLSQPALTASMKRLEEAFGTQLLFRARGGATLTEAGRALLPRARAALAAVEEGKRAVSEVTGLSVGEVRLGAGATVCTYLLPTLLAKYQAKYPRVTLALREITPDQALEGLSHGELDLAIVTPALRARLPTTLVREPFGKDELILVRAPTFVVGSDIEAAPFVSFRKGASLREILERHFPEARVAVEVGGISAVKAHVRAGLGIALLGRASVNNDIAADRLVEIAHQKTPISRPFVLLHAGEERLPPAAAALRKLLLEPHSRGSPAK